MTAHKHDSRKISDLLIVLGRNGTGDRVKLGDLLSVLGDRAFSISMLILALPNAVGLGAIPGLSTVFGLPQIFLALQMAVGMERPWLPRWLLERTIARKDLDTMIAKSMPYLLRIEKVLRPRWDVMSSYAAERILGAVFVVLASVVSLPIPFGNQPPAIGIALVSLGLVERDGMFIVFGLVASVIAVAIAAAVVLAGTAAVWLLITHLFGL
jgi:hypothetical protein